MKKPRSKSALTYQREINRGKFSKTVRIHPRKDTEDYVANPTGWIRRLE